MSDPGELRDQTQIPPMRKPNGLMGPRRARAACIGCRQRKVRCIAQNGQPCSNCTFENVQCVLVQKQRRRRSEKASAKRQDSSASVNAEASAATESSYAGYIASPQHQLRAAPSTKVVLEDQSYPELPPAPIQLGLGHLDSPLAQESNDEIDWRAAAVRSVPLPISPKPSSRGSVERTFSDLTRSSAASCIPSFLKPIPSYLANEDVDYLCRKGALSVPEPELRDALVESYSHYIHPCLPLLDLGTFTDILRGTSNDRISFTLFQAVMFAGAAWVDIKLLRRLGFLTRKAARRAFYLKARLLYDADYEQDRLCLVQTLLLLSLWWEGPYEQKDGWHWSGLSLYVARTIGLNRDINSQHLNPRTRGLRRRLWWCCTIRDTIASFGTNRPPRVRDSDFEVAPLTLDDFEFIESRSTNVRMIGAQDLTVQKQLATLCVQMVGICRIIGRVLQSAYAETSMGNIDTLFFNSLPKSGRTVVDPQKLKKIEEDFRQWKNNVPPGVLHASPTPSPSMEHEQAPLLHRAMLSMLYHTGLIMLHRQRASPSTEEMLDEQSASLAPEEAPRAIVRRAAAQVNSIVMDIYQADLMKYLPATGISCLFPVSISHVFDMKTDDPILRREGRHRLEECKQALRELADAHIAAEWAVNFLTYVESQVNAPTPSNRKLKGMISGEIQWAGTTPPLGADNVQTRVRQEVEQPRDVTNGIFAVDGAGQSFEAIAQPSAALHENLIPANGATSDLTSTPDTFPDLINFPQMWLNFAEAQGNSPGTGWLENDIIGMDFG